MAGILAFLEAQNIAGILVSVFSVIVAHVLLLFELPLGVCYYFRVCHYFFNHIVNFTSDDYCHINFIYRKKVEQSHQISQLIIQYLPETMEPSLSELL